MWAEMYHTGAQAIAGCGHPTFLYLEYDNENDLQRMMREYDGRRCSWRNDRRAETLHGVTYARRTDAGVGAYLVSLEDWTHRSYVGVVYLLEYLNSR